MGNFKKPYDDGRISRSHKYQHILLEVAYDDTFLQSFDNSRSINALLDPWQYNDELKCLEDQLIIELFALMKKELTKVQYFIISKLIEGYTQCEIAQMRGRNQSSITKALNGNIDYATPGHKKKTYGGLINKMRKAVKEDKAIQDLLEKISELREEKY